MLSPLRYRAEARIGLQPMEGGFGPPLPDGRRVRVIGADLHDGDASIPITDLAEAARFVGIEPGAPTPVYTPTTDGDPHRDLAIDPAAAAVVGRWFALGRQLLAEVTARAPSADEVTEAQLWPEHFDYALTTGPDGARANVGVSPGDGDHPEPYVYVGPWQPRSGPLWNETWGASLGYRAVRGGSDPGAFIRLGLQGLTSS